VVVPPRLRSFHGSRGPHATRTAPAKKHITYPHGAVRPRLVIRPPRGGLAVPEGMSRTRGYQGAFLLPASASFDSVRHICERSIEAPLCLSLYGMSSCRVRFIVVRFQECRPVEAPQASRGPPFAGWAGRAPPTRRPGSSSRSRFPVPHHLTGDQYAPSIA